MSYFDYPILTTYSTAIAVVAAVLLDHLLGEPRKWHPLIGFGRIAVLIESKFNDKSNTFKTKGIGLLAWGTLVIPPVFLVEAIRAFCEDRFALGAWTLDVLILYLTLGSKSLIEHAVKVYVPLSLNKLAEARNALSLIVSRDTSDLEEKEVSRATIESVLENGNDAIFSAIFWFLVFGAPGALMLRLANTLDAMWGYRTPRFVSFGWASARLDDFLNYIPARLTAFTYAICGNTRNAFMCWRHQAATWYSPNAGPVMSAGAGSINVRLGGPAKYNGIMKARPELGAGLDASARDIMTAVSLVNRSVIAWCTVIVGVQALMGAFYA